MQIRIEFNFNGKSPDIYGLKYGKSPFVTIERYEKIPFFVVCMKRNTYFCVQNE